MPLASLLGYIRAKHSYFAPNKEVGENKHARNPSYPLICNPKQHYSEPKTRYIRPKFSSNEAENVALIGQMIDFPSPPVLLDELRNLREAFHANFKAILL